MCFDFVVCVGYPEKTPSSCAVQIQVNRLPKTIERTVFHRNYARVTRFFDRRNAPGWSCRLYSSLYLHLGAIGSARRKHLKLALRLLNIDHRPLVSLWLLQSSLWQNNKTRDTVTANLAKTLLSCIIGYNIPTLQTSPPTFGDVEIMVTVHNLSGPRIARKQIKSFEWCTNSLLEIA